MKRVSLRGKASILVSVLLVLGAFSGSAETRSPYPESLVDAVHRGDTAQVLALLKERPDLQARDADGNTALHWAALNGNADLVKELLARGASPSATNQFGATPLLYAVGNVESVRALLKAADVTKNADVGIGGPSRFRSTPLIAAARYPDSSEVVRLLLEHGADGRSKSNALREAASAGDFASFKLLLATGARLRDVITPSMMGHREIVEAALDAGADLNSDGGHAGHALNFALYGHQPEIARLLIARGADLTKRSSRGNIRRRRFCGRPTTKAAMLRSRAR